MEVKQIQPFYIFFSHWLDQMYLPKSGVDPRNVDVAKNSSTISHVGLWVPFGKRTWEGAYKTKDFDAQVSMWVRWEWEMKMVR